MNLCAPPSTHKRKEQKRKASDHLNQPPIWFLVLVSIVIPIKVNVTMEEQWSNLVGVCSE